MLITRVAFDLLRAPSFRDAAASYIQRKLDQLRYPAYIDSLKVCCDTILVGCTIEIAEHPSAGPRRPGWYCSNSCATLCLARWWTSV
jgi:hypothetical protein